ncbi:MAG: hypothetical protein Q8940_08175 [Bacteroidota bacterium]|nr:hypothetical protein [Bacteroidota bacterium]
MQTKLCLILIMMFCCTCPDFALSKGEMKNSPLFKASLKSSIAKLEGYIAVQSCSSNSSDAAATSSAKCVQPQALHTQISTCEPSYCGSSETCLLTACYGSTCYSTCESTCNSQQSTCASTCASTCSGTTCGTASYCVACNAPYVEGTVYHANQGETAWSSDWNSSTSYRYVDDWQGHQTNFGITGYYFMQCGTAALNLHAFGDCYGLNYLGVAAKPHQGNIIIKVDIRCLKETT